MRQQENKEQQRQGRWCETFQHIKLILLNRDACDWNVSIAVYELFTKDNVSNKA